MSEAPTIAECMARSLTSQNQRDLLRWLDDAEWQRPMDLGATDASWHSGALRALVNKGLAERRTRSAIYYGRRGAYRYRRTPLGKIVNDLIVSNSFQKERGNNV